DLVGPAQVALDVGRRAVAAAQQRVRVGQDDRVVVDVDDAGVGRDLEGDGMGVVVVRDAGADVEELAQPAFAGEEADDPPEEGPVGPGVGAGALDAAGVGGGGVLGGPAVDLEVVVAAEEVVVDPRRVRDRRVDRGEAAVRGGGGGRSTGHLTTSGRGDRR